MAIVCPLDANDAQTDGLVPAGRTPLPSASNPFRIAPFLHARGWREVAALILLPVGGIVIPVVGWFVGVALLWSSEHWSVRSKLLGTLVVPGGLALPLSLGMFAGSTESCSTPPTLVGGASPDSVCTGGPSGWLEVLGPVAFVLLLLAPIATVIYLGLQLRHRPRTAPAMP